MKVTTVPELQPEVVITVSWEDAQILCSVFGGIGGASEKRDCTNMLYGKLSNLLGDDAPKYEFEGRFL